ncbi:MAG TPA: hypothetical protein VFZ58_03730 [Candidatus Saccharimonadales bacterium]
MKDTITIALRDKLALTLFITGAIISLIVLLLLFFWIQPSDIQIPIRYSGYDNSLFNDRWFERLAFPLFIIVQFGSNAWLALVVNTRDYKLFSYFLLIVSIFITLCVIPVAFALTNTITL